MTHYCSKCNEKMTKRYDKILNMDYWRCPNFFTCKVNSRIYAEDFPEEEQEREAEWEKADENRATIKDDNSTEGE